MTTSKRISVMFTLYTILIVFFFGGLINIAYFNQRSQQENMKLSMFEMPGMRPPPGRFRSNVESFPYSQKLAHELNKNNIINNISIIDNTYVMFKKSDNKIKIANINNLVESQKEMIRTFAILLVIFAILTYFLSLVFVKSSLKNIKKLVHYVDKLDINSLSEPVPITGPENDEIHKIGKTLQTTINTIKEQVESLKDFVTHASHELKTPLMSLNATIDSGEKTKEYKETFSDIKRIIYTINSLFDTLLLITKREYNHIKKTTFDCIPTIQEITNELKNIYHEKEITCTYEGIKELKINCHQDIFRIIIFNIIQNAFKYTPKNEKISIFVNNNSITISDSGIGIDEQNIKNIRKKFRKDHTKHESKEGFGLGLYLVHLLITKLQRNIQVKSTVGKGTTFTILLDS